MSGSPFQRVVSGGVAIQCLRSAKMVAINAIFMHIYSILLTIGHTTHRQGYKFFLAWPAKALLYVIKMMIRTVHEAWVRVFLLSHEQRIHTFCKYTSLPLIVINF